MSLSQIMVEKLNLLNDGLGEAINNNVILFVGNIYKIQTENNKFLTEQEMLDLWDSESPITNNSSNEEEPVKKSKDKKKVDDAKIANVDTRDHSQIETLLKPELIALCKTKKLKTTGTKQELIERITGVKSTETTSKKCKDKETKVSEDVPSNVPVKETGKKKTKAESKTELSKQEKSIIAKISAKIEDISIKRNVFGNYEHGVTKLVFNNKTEKVIGKQNPDGTVDELTEDDFQLCDKYKFKYEIPENLDKNVDITNVAVEGLDEEEILDPEDLEEEEEAEEEYEEEIPDDDDN